MSIVGHGQKYETEVHLVLEESIEYSGDSGEWFWSLQNLKLESGVGDTLERLENHWRLTSGDPTEVLWDSVGYSGDAWRPIWRVVLETLRNSLEILWGPGFINLGMYRITGVHRYTARCLGLEAGEMAWSEWEDGMEYIDRTTPSL
jgi:hypothetical protein